MMNTEALITTLLGFSLVCLFIAGLWWLNH